MQKIVYAAAIVLAMSACSGGNQEGNRVDSAPQVAAPAKAPTARAKATDEIANVIKRLQQQVALSVRYDRPRDVGESIERQVYIEMLGSTAEQTETVVVAAFEEAGFSVRKGRSDANGVRLQFRKAGINHVNALIRDQAASPAFKNPAGTSSLYLRQVQKD